MVAKRVRRGASLVLLAVSIVMLVWGFYPTPHETRRMTIPAADLFPPVLSIEETADSELMVVWPEVVRYGDVQPVRLDLVSGTSQNFDQPPLEANTLIEARLEAPGLYYAPPGETSQALLPTRSLHFQWELRANRAGEFDGTLWLYARYISNRAGDENRHVLTAQRLELRSVSFFGMSGPWARALGTAGAVIGAVFGLDGALVRLGRRFLNIDAAKDLSAIL